MTSYKIVVLFVLFSLVMPLSAFAESADDEGNIKESGEETEEVEEQTEESEETTEELEQLEVQNEEVVASQQEAEFSELKEGQRDDRLVEIKQMLNTIGFDGIIESNYFGSYTTKKVKEFQAYYQLESSGIIDEHTYNKIKSVYEAPREGTTSNDVLEMKITLNRINFGGIKETTYFGAYSAKKLKEFQSYYGLMINGLLDEITQSKLKEVSEAPQEGVRSEAVIDIKKKLNQIGFGGIIESSYYGAYTTKKVKEFQAYYNLNVNGIVDNVTYDLITEVYSSPFIEGDRNPRISDLKRTLNNLGFSGIKITDYFGSYTETKVKEFQSYYGLTVDGAIGPETRSKLEALEQAPQLGKRHEETIEIKEQLNRIGYGGILISTYFGSFTEKRVKEFQRANRLKVNGVADDVTITALNELSQSLQEGDRNPAVVELKKKLNTLDFSGILETTYFGSFTTKRLKEFQRYYNLTVDGIAGPETLAKLNEVYQSPKQGVRSSEIIQLKKYLNKLGFSGILETNYFGSFTKKRVKEFQRYYGLKVNGILEEKTVEELKDAANSPIQKGNSNSQIKNFKEDLDRAGFGGSIISNYLGSYTEGKIKEFQRYHGLKVNGIVEKKTLRTMNDVISYKLPRKTYNTVNGRQNYSYKDMQKDIDRLRFLYPNLIETKIIGESVDGRNIYAIKLGNGNKEVFFNGSHHAREHMTTNVLMNMVDEYARSYARMQNYNGYNTRRILNDVSIWFVPMVNPDGVMLVQEGPSTAKNPSKVISINDNSRDFKHWKANIRGVDLNRQYPYLWRTVSNDPGRPRYGFYKGKAPLSEPETKAIYDFTNHHNFKAAVAYHSSGELIYTRYGFDYHSRSIANGVKNITGYTPINLQSSTNGAGYTDWFVHEKKQPGITPEISPYVGERPIPLSNWNSVWNKNKTVGLYTANYVRLNQ